MKLFRYLLLSLFLVSSASATELIAVGNTKVDSADITAPFSLSIKPTAGPAPAGSDVKFLLELKTSGGDYIIVNTLDASNVGALGLVETGATYRVERQASVNVAGMDYSVPSVGAVTATLGAGSAVIGKVGIDQTTPGTTNGVQVNASALPTGAATAANQTATQKTIGSTVADRTMPIGGGGFSSQLSSYRYTANGYTAYTTPTDLFCLSGSASKTVYVTMFGQAGNATAATLETTYFIKRSAANTGGTSTTPTPVSIDSTNAAATAVMTVYTAAPSLGTAVGTLAIVTFNFAALTAPGTFSNIYTFATTEGLNTYQQPITLRGTSESLCANFNGAAWPLGGTDLITVEWTEATAP